MSNNFYDDLTTEKVPYSKDRPVNHIAFIMDHSGSMSSIAEQSRLNFNEQLEQIRKDSKELTNYVTIVEFDGNVKELCRNEDISTITKLENYWLGGMTALYDAIMHGISCIENDMPKEGNHAALITIITDGYENASVENAGNTGRLRVKERIKRLQKTDKWTFVFMGANQDVLDTAVQGLGIHTNNTMNFDFNVKGAKDSNSAYKMSYETYSESRVRGATSTVGFFDNTGDTKISDNTGDKANDN